MRILGQGFKYVQYLGQIYYFSLSSSIAESVPDIDSVSLPSDTIKAWSEAVWMMADVYLGYSCDSLSMTLILSVLLYGMI